MYKFCLTIGYAVSDIKSPHEWLHPENPCASLTLDLPESIQYKQLIEEITVRWLAEKEEEEEEGTLTAELEEQKIKDVDDKNSQTKIPKKGEGEEAALADWLSELARTFDPALAFFFLFFFGVHGRRNLTL